MVPCGHRRGFSGQVVLLDIDGLGRIVMVFEADASESQPLLSALDLFLFCAFNPNRMVVWRLRYFSWLVMFVF